MSSNFDRGTKRRRESTGFQDSKKKRGANGVENYASDTSPCNCKGSQKCEKCNMVLRIMNQDRLKGMPPPISPEATSSSPLPSSASTGSMSTHKDETSPSELRPLAAETEMEVDIPTGASDPLPDNEDVGMEDDRADDGAGNEPEDGGNGNEEAEAEAGDASTRPARPGLRPKGEHRIVISFEHHDGAPGRDVYPGYNNVGDNTQDTRDIYQEQLRNAIDIDITGNLRTREVLPGVPDKTPIFVLDLKTKMILEAGELYKQAGGDRNIVSKYLEKAMDFRIGEAEFARFIVCEDIIKAHKLLIFDQGLAQGIEKGQANQSANNAPENGEENDETRKTSTDTQTQAESATMDEDDTTMVDAESQSDCDSPDQNINTGSEATDKEAMEIDDGDRALVLHAQARQARYPPVNIRFAREDLRPLVRAQAQSDNERSRAQYPQLQNDFRREDLRPAQDQQEHHPPAPNAGLMPQDQQSQDQQGHGHHDQLQHVQPNIFLPGAQPGMGFPAAGITVFHTQGFTQTNTIEIGFGGRDAGRAQARSQRVAWNTHGTTYLPHRRHGLPRHHDARYMERDKAHTHKEWPPSGKTNTTSKLQGDASYLRLLAGMRNYPTFRDCEFAQAKQAFISEITSIYCEFATQSKMPGSKRNRNIFDKYGKTTLSITQTIFGAKHTRFSDDEETTPSAKRQKREHEPTNSTIKMTPIESSDNAEATSTPGADHSSEYASKPASKTRRLTDQVKRKLKNPEGTTLGMNLKSKTLTGSKTSQSQGRAIKDGISQGSLGTSDPQDVKTTPAGLSHTAEDIPSTPTPEKASAESIHSSSTSAYDAGDPEEGTDDGNDSPSNDKNQNREEPSQANEPEDSRDHDPKIIVSRAEVGKNYHKKYNYLSDDEKVERDNVVLFLKRRCGTEIKYTQDLMPLDRIPYNCPHEVSNLGMPFLNALRKIWSRADYKKQKVFYWIDNTAKTKYPSRPNAKLGSEDIRHAADLMRDADVRAETVTRVMGALSVDHVSGFEEYEKKENLDETKKDEKEKKARFRRSAEF
ncbi:uncharacterized protein MYCFIDRAFT_79256 [Pseudocercospora fijiensis CIRAD86]|uniref:Uncharacterized protein n=1 Tax=Pseudocercospora fijiensis (strain CIRAD86) TaxID=383855 RepID=M3AKL9_PSEFD|nr:uncharacterized protein MYCFIDRAFT_79256 [Pseudocercospora fijiensis CIRAD86]EME78017.1 hypothetical protein MYCFIDRAFT_79256 [Pseudocercospora fijiensis CIRAD86]